MSKKSGFKGKIVAFAAATISLLMMIEPITEICTDVVCICIMMNSAPFFCI